MLDSKTVPFSGAHMTITIDPQTEAVLRAIAEREHLLPEEFVTRLIQREAHQEPVPQTAALPQESLVQFFRRSPFVGLDLEFERSPDTGREVQL